MTVRLVCGPPGAGKNTYVEKHKQPGDYVLDFDVLKTAFPSLKAAKAVRKQIEESLKDSKTDAWVIRGAADPAHRAKVAERCGASEVIVIPTPAAEAKRRVAERGWENESSSEILGAIDTWWSQYAMVESDLIVQPDMGNLSDREKNNMGDLNDTDETRGYPLETPVVEMTDKQQAAYWKAHSRKHENQVKAFPKDYDEIKALADKYRELEANGNQDSVDLDAVRKEGELAALKRIAPHLVKAEFKAQTAGRIAEDRLELLLEDYDLTKYLKEDGTVDTDRVKTRAEVIAPVEEPKRRRTSTTHQNRRTRDGQGASGVEAGRALFEEMHGTK